MSSFIVNSTPMPVDLGRDDRSQKTITPQPLPRPTHCPKFWLYTQKPRTGIRLVDGAQAAVIYGDKTFDSKSPYYNHATVYATGIMSEANSIIIDPVVPDDATRGSLILWAEIATADVPVYQRDSATGKEILDNQGNPIPQLDPADGVTPLVVDGYKIRWSLTAHSTAGSTPAVEVDFGNLSPKVGVLTQKDGSTSTAYPIMEFRADYKGAAANLVGIRMYPAKKDNIPSTAISKAKFLPFHFEVIMKEDAGSTPTIVSTIYGEKQPLYSFKEHAEDPGTGRTFDIAKVIEDYSNTTDTSLPMIVSEFEDIHVYYENYETILTSVFTKEAAYLDSPTAGVTAQYAWYDFDSNDPDNKHLMGTLSAQSSSGAAYFTLRTDTSNGGIGFTSLTNLMMANGSDGTMDDTSFAALVKAKVSEYADINSPVMDNAINVESAFYDSGFPLDTKKALMKVLGNRKDTYLSLSTYVSGTTPNTVSEDLATAITLQASLGLYPDSSYYGTGIYRATITGKSAIIKNHPYKKRVGRNYDLAIMTAKAMGASNRIWNLSQGLGRYPGNVVTETYKALPEFIPTVSKYSLWENGVIWTQPYDARSEIFTGIQTVYGDQTSVLKNYIVMMATIELDKIAWDAWRTFTNTSCATDAQLAELVTNYCNDRITAINSFDGCVRVNVQAFQTVEDEQRGYSWHLTFQVGGPNLKTVETISIETYRINELP